MQEIKENIWKFKNEGEWIVICTNGSIKESGESIMTDNKISSQADIIYDMDKELGDLVAKKGNIPFVFSDFNIITLPVKDTVDSDISIDLIKTGVTKLVRLVNKLKLEKVYISKLDTENKTNWKKRIRPFLKIALDDRFVIVTFVKEKEKEKY